MSRWLIFLFVAFICINGVLSAPADDDKDEAAAAAPKDKNADDRAVQLSEPSIMDTLFSGGNAWTIIQGALATLFIVGGLGLAFYYFYYMNYANYNQALTTVVPETFSGYQAGYPQATSAYSYYPTGRALPGGNFNFAQVLDLISIAQTTYEKFDFQSLECQKKALCELQQKQDEFGETGRKISTTFSYVSRRFMDALDGLPMPAIIQTYLREYKEAIFQGKNSSKDCAAVYPKCDFSIKEVFVKYGKKGKKQQH